MPNDWCRGNRYNGSNFNFRMMEKLNNNGIVKFCPKDWDAEYSYFEGIKMDSGRYSPIRRFKVDRYRVGHIETGNTHKSVEFMENEINFIVNEDDLPEMTDSEYNKWHEKSFILNGFRVGVYND